MLERITASIENFAASASSLRELEELAAREIAGVPGYDWSGFYWVDQGDAEMLVLGAFVGAPTEHVRIPLSSGICGAAVAQAKAIVVDDVARDPRYLACSLETKSEIVVPIHAGGRIVGEIDIDSHSPARFGAEDRAFLERCAGAVGAFIETTLARE
ncbi:MAG: GAF domain-containing protein [Terracidiphilus sp.]|jgi:GAF domain-containing protein